MNTKTSLSMCALVFAFSLPAFAQDAKSISEAETAKWLQAYNKGDAAALTALYAKDAVLIAPIASEPILGTAAIRKFFDTDLAHPVMGLSIKSTEAKTLDPNTIIETGTWSGDVPGENGGAAIHIKGAYVSTYVHQGQDWLLRVDSANMAPPPKK